jgi:hypothetical protein
MVINLFTISFCLIFYVYPLAHLIQIILSILYQNSSSLPNYAFDLLIWVNWIRTLF